MVRARSRIHPVARMGVVLASVVLAGCAQTPTAGPSTSPSPAATSSPAGLLFAVVEGDPQPGTVAIVGLDGYAKAKASFQPRQRPYIGNAAAPLQPVAQVAGASVFYIDGSGTVRVLRANAAPRVIATFPQQPVQFETWFAVSPDGSRALAGVLQYPDIGTAPSPCNGLECLPPLVGPTKFDLMSAQSGSPPTVLKHFDSSQLTSGGGTHLVPDFPVGWTPAGAVVMVPVSIGTQNAWWGGPLYLVDDLGKQVRQIGGSDCNAASIGPGQYVACTSGTYGVSVRDLSGNIVWTTRVEGFDALALSLSPDGQGVSDGTQVETRAGGLVSMPSAFTVEGWLDNNTVVGRQFIGNTADRGNLSWISLDAPGTIHDLGFKGDFIGTLAS